MDLAYAYPELTRTDEVIPALFKHEFERFHRGFVFGMFGSSTVKTGSGKSDSTCMVCHEQDDDFNANDIMFTPGEILHAQAKTQHRGHMIMADETQNYASNRTWFDLNNKTVMHTVATMRYRRQGCGFVTPMARMIDKDVQKMMRFAMSSFLTAEPPNGTLAGWIRIREVATYNDDKDIARRMLKFYDPEAGQVIELDQCRVYLTDEPWLQECRDRIEEYKDAYRGDLQEEADQFDEAEKALYRKSGIFKPKMLAEKMLEESSVVKELSEKGKIQHGMVAAFFPNLKSTKDLSAVKWWVEDHWKKLNTVKKDGQPTA